MSVLKVRLKWKAMNPVQIEKKRALQISWVCDKSAARGTEKTHAAGFSSRIREGAENGVMTRPSPDKTVTLISYDNDIARIVVQIFDAATSRVIRQIPSEDVAAFLKKFRTAVPLAIDITV